MDPARILQIITNSTWMVTKLVGSGPVEFDKPHYIAEVLENTRPQLLVQLRARVQPQASGPIEFILKEGNDEGYFSLDRFTGRLTLKRPLDFEEKQQHYLLAEVTAGDASSQAKVDVRVLDVNDHVPAFPRALHETQITEEDDRHLPKTILTQVTATDEDGSTYSQLRYSLSGDGVYTNGTKSSFDIDERTGAIHLLKPLDRDPPQGRSQWRLKVRVTDGEFDAYTAVHVNLKDINDNAPFFSVSTINATISENTPKGASVAQVTATDNDDPQEGQNARLVYSLEKNVIDEASGRPIFKVDSTSGLITTALCCLDREKTQRYSIQVVATDGGGLKGTGTVLVEVSDVNDVPPKFSRAEWTLDVSESLTPDSVLATLTVIDQDVSNNFTFRVVPRVGRGWEMFHVKGRANGAPGGDLKAAEPLDYENEHHRKGFKFKVQVSDIGDEGWNDLYHVDGAWVNVNLVDANDNAPVFQEDHAHLTLAEDTPMGTMLATFTAHDIDGGGRSRVRYRVAPASDPGGLFGVDRSGTVRLVGRLDRETTNTHHVLVLATDDGVPPRTATATLSVNVTDVNDNPPFLAKPREVQVLENADPQVVAEVKLNDLDDWRQGHGPPYTIALDPRAPPHIRSAIKVRFEERGDEGRGVGVVSTQTGLDREEHRALFVPLVVGDAGSPSLSATVTLTLHVADLNDNPMAPASKVITVHTVQPQTTPVPLGRIYVKDPDDWDATSKTYRWRQKQHPNFLLNSKTGDLSLKPATRDGRYDLSFSVSDASQDQVGVSANVSVRVKSLTHREVNDATPITLAINPYRIVREEKNDKNLLDYVVSLVREWVPMGKEDVEAVSVQQVEGPPTPSTRIWLSSHSPVSLQHILLHRKQELEDAIGASVLKVGVGSCPENSHERSTLCIDGCSARVSLGSGFSVVDANTSALVGPWVNIQNGCTCQASPLEEDTCKPNTCLNGGRCIPTKTGTKCICPFGTSGSRCKILIRHFKGGGGSGGGGGGGGGDGVEEVGGGERLVSRIGDRRRSSSSRGTGSGTWAWVPSVPSCAEIHISFEFLTDSEDATLLYAGPDHMTQASTTTASPSSSTQSDMLFLELREGRPSLQLDLGAGASILHLNSSYSLADSTWHRLDVIWRDEFVEMFVDLCSGGSIEKPLPEPVINAPTGGGSTPTKPSYNATSTPSSPVLPDDHTCRGASRLPRGAHLLNVAQPLQLGGLSHPPPSHTVFGWPRPISAQPLNGCLRNLRINGELMDLGHQILSEGSSPGCPALQCESTGLNCGVHGRCQGSPGELRCECHPGWTGPQCATSTTPASFQVNSYVKLALSFTPLAYTTTLHLRFRTWKRHGELIVLSSQHGRDRFALELENGHLCLQLEIHPGPPRDLCLSNTQLSDGHWHTIEAARYGSATFLTADDGEGDFYNASLSLEGRQLLEIDKQEGIHLGGSPEYVGVSVFSIHGDYHDSCLDDVRISGKSVPLPPAVNGTPWGQTSMFKGVERGCRAPSACANVSCNEPFSCIDTWRSYNCGCGEGRVLSSKGNTCEDEDECVWEPCLNGGSCFNKESAGYLCACPSGFSGQHCHLPNTAETSLKLSLGALVAIIVWCTFLLLLICAFLLHQHHRRSALRRGMADVKENHSMVHCNEQPSSPCSHTPNLLELKLIKPPKANGQPAWSKNPNIADVDVLQVDAASVTSSLDDQQKNRCSILTSALVKNGARKSCGGCQEDARNGGKKKNKKDSAKGGGSGGGSSCITPAGDDLRNYAYEGDGSSPGSLSSCLESCSGSAKFLDGFREVAHMLESWDPTNSHSSHSSSSKGGSSKDLSQPVTTIPCDIHDTSCSLEGRKKKKSTSKQLSYPDQLPPPLSDGTVTSSIRETVLGDTVMTEVIPMPIPEPPRAFKTK